MTNTLTFSEGKQPDPDCGICGGSHPDEGLDCRAYYPPAQPIHTPGPWIATNDDRVVVRSDNQTIAQVFGYGLALRAQANARLIAAAPELLEVAEEALTALFNIGGEYIRKNQCFSPGHDDDHKCTVCKLKTALVKAKGY